MSSVLFSHIVSLLVYAFLQDAGTAVAITLCDATAHEHKFRLGEAV